MTGVDYAVPIIESEVYAGSYRGIPVDLGDSLIKVELIREGRVTLAPAVRPSWSPVGCLAP